MNEQIEKWKASPVDLRNAYFEEMQDEIFEILEAADGMEGSIRFMQAVEALNAKAKEVVR